MRTILVTYKGYSGYVAQDTVNEFQKVILATGVEQETTPNFTRLVSHVFLRMIPRRLSLLSLYKKNGVRKFCIIVGHEFQKCLFSFLNNAANYLYIFDAWPAYQDWIAYFIHTMRVRHVFFSSRSATELFSAKGLNCTFTWIPEAITPDDYRFAPYTQKDISVLAFGRRYDEYHDAIVDRLAQENITYLYEKVKAELVFRSREEFIDGLARTRISICVPSSITHPEKSGGISTMTMRYLQSMASKALIVGYMPEEMKTLFDYMPIVEIDKYAPAEQLLAILNDFDQYIPLIERNYAYIQQHHTWEHRWATIRQALKE
jgi:hypothetical protein